MEKKFSYTPTLEMTVDDNEGGCTAIDLYDEWGSTFDHDEAVRICNQIATEVRDTYHDYYQDLLKERQGEYYAVTIVVDEQQDDMWVCVDVEEIVDRI